ncbi:hypothetical protein BpHYR1_051689 [Brachionus plicatilis]|uniref:Uncharacterized protein n=1 Tax=Brachionus plicatilis TaxID=10195 RepID=A0A3M7SRC2_BRAPC|nr:hypothetical protein BpHYR1_051689 [Brachionus plicatilis]
MNIREIHDRRSYLQYTWLDRVPPSLLLTSCSHVLDVQPNLKRVDTLNCRTATLCHQIIFSAETKMQSSKSESDSSFGERMDTQLF